MTAVSQVRAVDRFWDERFGGVFSNGANWAGGIAPGTFDFAYFGVTTNVLAPASYAVTFTNSPTNQALRIEDDLVAFDLNGQTYSLSTSSGTAVGTVAGRSGHLTILDGTLHHTVGGADLAIGTLVNSAGFLNISTGGRITGSPTIVVGAPGSGTLTVENGGTIQPGALIALGFQVNSTGTATVTGAGSSIAPSFLSVGSAGNGTLTVLAGGAVNASGTNVIGNSTGGTGLATISGAGSAWNNAGELQIGNLGQARMDVVSDGLVQSSGARIGVQAAATNNAVFAATGGRWLNTGNMLIGDAGVGQLNLQDGGIVENSNGSVQLGSKAGGQGHVHVSGAGSQFIVSHGIDIGTSGRASMRIFDGGLVRSGFAILARNSGIPDVVRVEVSGANSLWDITSGLLVGGNDQAELTITDGGEVRGHGLNDFTISNLSTVTVDGAGSKWNTTNFFAIRGGTLTITNGGEARHNNGNLGGTSGGTGEGIVNVDGANSKWTLAQFIAVGTSSGSATLNIGAGATVTAGGFLSVGTFASPTVTSTGTVNLNGGELAVAGVTFNETSVMNFNAGTFRFNAGASLDDGLLDKLHGQAHAITSPQHLAVNETATLQTSLIIDGGTFSAGQLVNPQLLHLERGTLNLTNQAVAIEPGGALGASLDLPDVATINVTLGITNRGLITGGGRLGGPFLNDPAGELRVEPGKSLTLTGAATNSGRINLIDGLLECTQPLINNASGLIAGRGTLIADGGLTNQGQIQLSGGPGDYFGSLTNTSGAKVIITGNATGTFFNDVTNNAGSEFRVSTGATAVFMGAVSGSAAFTGGGTKIFNGSAPSSVAALASLVGNTVVDPSTSLTAGHVRENALEVYGRLAIPANGTSAATSKVNTLIIDGGRFDLRDNQLIVAGGSLGTWNGSAYTGVTGLIDAGRGSASDAQWNGSGIVTSDPRAINSGNLASLGIATAGQLGRTTFGGLSVAPTDVLVMFTWGGDANLDGKINIDDYGRIDSNVGTPGANGWFNGDFNYDGKINIDDYGIIDSNISAPAGGLTAGGAMQAVVAVPEPQTFTALAAVLGLASGRRRRRRQRRS